MEHPIFKITGPVPRSHSTFPTQILLLHFPEHSAAIIFGGPIYLHFDMSTGVAHKNELMNIEESTTNNLEEYMKMDFNFI